MRKLYLMLTATVLLTGILITSCDKKQIETEKDKIINVELGFKNPVDKNNVDFFNINYNFENPLLSQSDDLVVVEALNEETGLNAYIIITEKDKDENVKQFSIRSGYSFDGNDCFIYGTIVTGDNGGEMFIPADAATQSTMNVCGYANVC